MQFIKKFIVLLSLSIFINSQSESNTIIYLISPPRSLSVAFLRMMQARGDFHIMHEPSQAAYCKLHSPTFYPFFKSTAFQTYAEVQQGIFDAAKAGPVFAKEMSFAIKEFIIPDTVFMQNPHIQFVFLLRNPHHSIISFYKALGGLCGKFEFYVGYQSMYEIFTQIKRYAPRAPIIISSEDLYLHPRETVEKFCAAAALPFNEKSLTWENLGEQFSGQEEWHEPKHSEVTHHWHKDAIRSTGFGAPTSYSVDANGKPTFEEIINDDDRKVCLRVYEESLHYYQLLMNETDYLLKKIKN